MYKKGSRAERELADLFAEKGYGILRSAGSGRSRHPCPDLIAGDGKKTFAIECKSSRKDAIYIEKEDVLQLEEFSRRFGSESIVAARFNNEKWLFLKPSELKKTKDGNYKVSKESGIAFDDLA